MFLIMTIISMRTIARMGDDYERQLRYIATDGLASKGNSDGPIDLFDEDHPDREYGDGPGQWDETELEYEKKGEEFEALFQVVTVLSFIFSIACLVAVCGCYVTSYWCFHSSVKGCELEERAVGAGGGVMSQGYMNPNAVSSLEL